MALDLNNQTVLIYNNVYLGKLIQAELESTPVYDVMGTLEYVTHKVTIESIIPGGDTKSDYLVNATNTSLPDYEDGRTDDIVHLMRALLSTPRRALYMLNSGSGSTIIDGSPASVPLTRSDIETFLNNALDTSPEFPSATDYSDYNKDLNMGPTPKVLRWEPIGGRGACRVVFEVEFNIKECLTWGSLSNLPIGRMSSFTYKTSYTIDDMYLTTRKTNGVLKMHQNVNKGVDARVNAEILSGSVDGFRDSLLFNFPTPLNFRRKEKTFTVNENKSELEFSLTDVEIDSEEPYPRNVLEIEASHSLDSKGPTFVTWENELNCTITLKPGTPYYEAFNIFLQILGSRLARSRAYEKTKTKRDSDGNKVKTTHKVTAIPTKIRISEKMFKRRNRFEFSFGWKIPSLSAPEDIFLATGIFTSIANDNGGTWQYWKDSIKDMDYDPRGSLNFKDNPSSIIVDSCLNASEIDIIDAINNDNSIIDQPAEDYTRNTSTSDLDTSIFKLKRQDVTEQTSLMDYRNLIELDTESNTYQYTCSIDPNSYTPGEIEGTYYNGEGDSNVPKYAGGISSELYKKGAGSTTHSIELSAPSIVLRITGYSKRMLGPTPSPKVLKVGGAEVECIKDKYVSDKLTEAEDDELGIPVFASAWVKEYRVLGTPKNFHLETTGEVNPTS